MNLRFICAQPATLYYAWQVDVMLNNFIQMGVNPKQIDIVCFNELDNTIYEWIEVVKKYPANFFFYKDTRKTKHYISSIRPNILKQHWETYPELKDQTVFYHDCDIVFTKPISEWITDEMVNDSNWYGSDTKFYIGHNYIKSKGEDVLEAMCDIIGIYKEVVERNEENTIGAQYIIKNVDAKFWELVELDSEDLYKNITDLNNTKKMFDPTYHELQIWCADMWALLWTAWKAGNTTIIHPNLTFAWGTSNISQWSDYNIMHNAGVTSSSMGYFYKSAYTNQYPPKDLDINKDTCSYMYYQLVKQL